MTKSKKTKLFQPRYSKKLQDFIVDKIEEGQTIAEICREYKQIVPIEKTLYRWKKKYPEFKKAVDDAYQTLIFKMVDELNDLSKQAVRLAEELANTRDIDDAKFEAMKLKGQLDAVKTRMKAIEFMLNKIAPKLVPELRDRKQDTIGNLPPINVISFHTESSEIAKRLATQGVIINHDEQT